MLTDLLVKALAKAQSEFPVITKDSRVDFTSNGKRTAYNYAALDKVIRETTPTLNKNGLVVTQTTTFRDGATLLVTRLMHVSGQEIFSEYPISTAGRNQEKAAEITYQRRYQWNAIIGIHPEDDLDGADLDKEKPTITPTAKSPFATPIPKAVTAKPAAPSKSFVKPIDDQDQIPW